MSEDARVGKKLIVAVIVIILAMSLAVSLLSTLVRGPEKLLAEIVRFVLETTLCYYLYIGHAWARWVLAVLFGAAGIASAFAGMWMPSAFMLVMAASYIFCATVLAFSRSAAAFLQQQRASRLADSRM